MAVSWLNYAGDVFCELMRSGLCKYSVNFSFLSGFFQALLV